MTSMDDLVAFLRARLDSLEELANAARAAPATEREAHWPYPERLAHMLLASKLRPDYVLADIDAKRQIIDLHPCVGDDIGEPFCVTCTPDQDLYLENLVGKWPCPTLRLLALPYADHPDYRGEWRP